MKIFVYLVSVLIAGTLSQEIPSKDELLKQVPGLANIPGFAEFNTSSIKVEDVEKVFREKCEKSGGPTAFDKAKNAPIELNNCFQSLVNVSQLQKEMDAARPNGDLDEVFGTYCEKVPRLKTCVRNVTNSIEPCLEQSERDSVEIIHNITSSLLEFICFNEGDRIAMFIAAGGVECFKSKQEAVQKCANETFGKYVPVKNSTNGATPALSSIPLLVLSLKECQDIEKFRTCTVNVLENCTDPTPANVVESLFNFVKKVTPCDDILKKNETPEQISSRSTGSHGVTHFIDILSISLALLSSLRFF